METAKFKVVSFVVPLCKRGWLPLAAGGFVQISKAIILLIVMSIAKPGITQSLQETLAQCPLTIQNETITYYLPQQNGGFFQLPPARKPRYVNMLTSPFVPPLQKSVQATQQEVLSELLLQTAQPALSVAEKELFLRKLAWCVMLQTSKAKDIGTEILSFVRSMSAHADDTLSMQTKLVERLVEDYRNFGSQ